MAIEVTCCRCSKVLDKPGAIILGPPDSMGLVHKWHLCVDCYYTDWTEPWDGPSPQVRVSLERRESK